jgi:hypothetical protein
VFTVAERERVRARLLELAEADPSVAAAAVTGSAAVGDEDEWSDVDLAFAIPGDLQDALGDWTHVLYGELGALHHWDLPFGSTVYRVFLLPGCLEVDIAFAPIGEFGPRGRTWRTVFGEAAELSPPAPPPRDELVGRAWHHVLHARSCIERGKPWQAEYWISAVRDQVIALACLRLGHETAYAKGAHHLPEAVRTALEPGLVRSLDRAELRRALAAAAGALADELDRTDATLATRLRPVLAELAPTRTSSARTRRAAR